MEGGIGHPVEAMQAAALRFSATLQKNFQELRNAGPDVDTNKMAVHGSGRTNEEQLHVLPERRSSAGPAEDLSRHQQNKAEILRSLGLVMHLSPQIGNRRKLLGGKDNQNSLKEAHPKLLEDIKSGASQTWSRVQHYLGQQELRRGRSWRGRHAQFATIGGVLETGSNAGHVETREVVSKGSPPVVQEAGLPGLRENFDEAGAVEKPEWTSEQQKRGREGRFLIHEVQILDSEGNDLELDHPQLKSLIQKTMKISNRPGFAFNVKEVHEDIDRLGRLGLFENVVPYTKDTRDGVVLQLHIAPHPVVRKVVVKGSDVLPTSLIQKETKPLINKVLNMNDLYEVIDHFKTWYVDKKFFASVKPETLDPDGTLTLTAHEPRLRRIDVKVQSGDNPDKVGGYTKMDSIKRNLILKEGQLMNGETLRENKQLLHSMGIFADVNIIPTEVFDGENGEEDLVYPWEGEGIPGGYQLELREKYNGKNNRGTVQVAGGFNGGGGSGDFLSGLSFSSAWSHSNLFGEGKRLRLEGEKGAGIFKVELDYLDPWLDGDNKRTGRRVQIRNLKTVDHIHCPKPEDMVGDPGRTGGSPAIAKRLACIEYSRPLRPEWLGRAGIQYQSATLKDDFGETQLVDMYGSPLTFSGKPRDDALVVYGNLSWSTQLFLSMKQGLPIAPNWLCFNEMTANWKKGLIVNDYLELQARLQAGTVVGDLAPYDAFELGGTGSVRGWNDGELGTSKSHVAGSLEAIIPIKPNLLEGVLFVDAATDFNSGKLVLGDPAGVRGRPGKGYGFGGGARVMSPIGPIRLEYGINDRFQGRYHFGLG